MDGAADATAAALGAWASVRGFFTPATLFIVVNLVIGTIALSSHFQQRLRRRDSRDTAHDDADADANHQEPPSFHQAQHHDDNHFYDDQQQYVPPPPAPEPLARTSSVLDRLRSIGLYRFRSGDFPPEYAAGTDSMAAPAPASGDAHHARSRSAPAPAREVRRRPAASRTRKSSRSVEQPEVAPPPAARLVQAALLEEDDALDVEEVVYAREHEFTGSNFATPPASLQLQEEEEEEHSDREEYVPPLRHARPPSVLERIRSFGFRSGEPAADLHAANAGPVEEEADDVEEEEYARADVFADTNFTTHRQQPPAPDEEEQYYREEYVPPPRPAPLARAPSVQEEEEEHSYRDEYVPPLRPPRAPSVLERIRSFGFRSGDLAADHAANAVPVEEQVDDVEEEEYARADVFTDRNFTTHRQQQQAPHEEEQYYREEYVPPPRPAPLARAPSVLERLRSFGLSRFSSSNIAADDAALAVAELERNHAQKQAKMTKSRSEPSRGQSNKGKKQQESAEAKMSKSGSTVARKPAPVAPQAEEGGVDARADDFINSFRKQLQLQRVNSLLNYKDMLNRGA